MGFDVFVGTDMFGNMNERGQTIPFWAFATLGVLALMLTVLNYGAQVYWNVRAQTAADSAAAGALSVQANILNEETTILYAAAVDEYRLRELNQAILNTLNQQGGCKALGTCTTNYPILTAAFSQASKNFSADIQLLAQANQFSQGGQSNHKNEAQSLLGNCGGNNTTSGATSNAFDTAFCYTVVGGNTNGNGNNGGNNTLSPLPIAVVACRTQPYVGGAVAGTSAGTFTAVAASAATLSSANAETVTVSKYQTREVQWYGNPALTGTTTQPYAVDFSNLTVNLNWYTAAPFKTGLVSGFAPSTYACLVGP